MTHTFSRSLTPVSAVDSHAHVFRHDLPFADGRRHSPDFDAPLAEYLGLLDANGVSHALLVQPSFLGTDNTFLLAALRANPDRLRGVAVVDPSVSDAELQALAGQGVCGIRLNLVGAAIPDLRSRAWVALLQRVKALNWHVELHLELPALPPVGQAVIDSGCRLVIDHFGRPGAADAAGLAWMLNAAGTGRVWVKLSAAYRNWAPSAGQAQATAAAARLLKAFGPERLLWGSDWPHTQHRDLASFPSTLASLHAWVPDAAARQTILVDTPCRLFQFSSGDNNESI
ncbi:amidohydrolase family protein [Variovorax rhizosphaerae]|uniref:Amidohydrolase family protein n=1 Tax=Variovorax rhizosphaerae TaxID=1836200 RepID=A0ABU8WEZ7_9BURK